MWSICLTPSFEEEEKTPKKLVIQSIWQLNFHRWFAFHFRILFDMQCCAKNHLFIHRIRVCGDSESFNTLIDKLNLNKPKRPRRRRSGKTVHIHTCPAYIEFGIVCKSDSRLFLFFPVKNVKHKQITVYNENHAHTVFACHLFVVR